MKPSIERVSQGVALLSELISFFPKSVAAKAFITSEVHSFVANEDQLVWFIDACVRHFPQYEGVPALRALFNTKYAPADGVMPTTNIPGSSTEELEAKHERDLLDWNIRRQEHFERLKAIGPPEDGKPFPLPNVKRLPKPN